MKLNTVMPITALLALVFASGTASATEIIKFNQMNVAAYYGKANVSGQCTGFTTCYTETGAPSFYIGTNDDPAAGPFTHLHRGSNGSSLQHHADAAGIYGRRIDRGTFDFNSFDAIDVAGDNGGVFQVVAFSRAYNTDIIGSSVNYKRAAGYIGQQTITRADRRTTVSLDQSIFANIKAFAIFYDGYNYTPSDGTDWDIVIDNVTFDAVVAPVPVPAAAYLFATGLIGLVSFGRKKATQLTA